MLQILVGIRILLEAPHRLLSIQLVLPKLIVRDLLIQPHKSQIQQAELVPQPLGTQQLHGLPQVVTVRGMILVEVQTLLGILILLGILHKIQIHLGIQILVGVPHIIQLELIVLPELIVLILLGILIHRGILHKVLPTLQLGILIHRGILHKVLPTIPLGVQPEVLILLDQQQERT